MNVEEFMTGNVITCNENQTVEDVVNVMLENNLSAVPIINNDEQLVGLITESDFVGEEVEIPHALATVKHILHQKFYFCDVEDIYKKAKYKTLKEVMSEKVCTVAPGTSLTNVVQLMMHKNIKRLPVVDEKKLVGIVTRKDLLKAFKKVA